MCHNHASLCASCLWSSFIDRMSLILNISHSFSLHFCKAVWCWCKLCCHVCRAWSWQMKQLIFWVQPLTCLTMMVYVLVHSYFQMLHYLIMLFNAGDIAIQFPLCVSCAHTILIMIIFVIFTRMGPYDHVNLKNYFRLLQQGNFILLESSCLCLFASCLLLSLRDWSCVFTWFNLINFTINVVCWLCRTSRLHNMA